MEQSQSINQEEDEQSHQLKKNYQLMVQTPISEAQLTFIHIVQKHTQYYQYSCFFQNTQSTSTFHTNSKCALYYDNKEIIKKVKKTKTTANYYKLSYKMSEHEAIIAIQKYLLRQLIVIHVYSHQDKIKGKNNLTFPEN